MNDNSINYAQTILYWLVYAVAFVAFVWNLFKKW